MIEESLLKSNFVGKDGFIWWIGQVAPASVWRNEKSKPDAGENKKESKSASWAYRCKVRIIGYHTFDGGVLPDDELPWAHISVGAETGSAQGGVGQTLRLVGGETVYGFFIDGDDAQQPVIVGCLHRNESVSNLIDESFLEKEKSSQFKPFSANTGNLAQGPTQIRRLNDAVQGSPKENSQPQKVGGNNLVGDPVTSTREENKPGAIRTFLGDKIPFIGKGSPISGFGKPDNKLPTPPLPETPQPKVPKVSQKVNPATNLTRTETALLSPSEQAIKQKI